MYLSRLIPDPRDRAVQREIANPYELHRTVMAGFPADLPDEERVLFRLDAEARIPYLSLLVQSITAPDWHALTDRPGYLLPLAQCPAPVRSNPATKTFDLSLSAGQMLAFRLRANPTVKRQGKRHGLYREEDQRAWIERKAQRGGFRLIRVSAAREDEVHALIKPAEDEARERRRRGTFLAVRFEGVLQVTDPDQLAETVRRGIGSAKGFGFGLLSLAPAL